MGDDEPPHVGHDLVQLAPGDGDGWAERHAHALSALERLELGDDWLRRVCHDNAARVFSLA